MSNENIQGPVDLAGRGYTYRANDKFQPGEYKALLNVDITDEGTLVNRKPLQGMVHTETQPLQRWIGTLKSKAIAVGESVAGADVSWVHVAEQQQITSTPIVNDHHLNLYNHFDAVFGLGVPTWRHAQYEGVFEYNGFNYFIVLYSYRDAALAYKQALFTIKVPLTEYQPSAPSTPATGSTLIENISVPIPALRSVPEFKVKNFILDRERLWIATKDTVYFSAATNPQNFTAPSGGFFKFPDMNIRKIIALSGIIYVFGDSSVKAIQYTTDPNLDAQVNIVSDHQGCDDAVLVGDTVYMVRPNALYEVRGLNVSKMVDLLLDIKSTANGDFNTYQFDLGLKAFNEDLYIIPRTIYYTSNESDNPQIAYRVSYSIYDPSFQEIHCFYRMSLSNGSISQYSFPGTYSTPTDGIYIPIEDQLNQRSFIWIHSIPSEAGLTAHYSYKFNEHPAFYRVSVLDDEVYNNVATIAIDTKYFGGLTMTPMLPAFLIWIRHYSPDNLRYQVKKFRYLLLEADLPTPLTRDSLGNPVYKPSLKLLVRPGLDGLREPLNGAGAPSAALDPNYGSLLNEVLVGPYTGADNDYADGYHDTRLSNTYRYPVNQRCRHVDLIIGTYRELGGVGTIIDLPSGTEWSGSPSLSWADYGSLTDAEFNKRAQASSFEFSDIRALWSYTSRFSHGPNAEH